ncbi:hypothetical protein [uncultured Sulfitobacter sp.]|uniref:hypothetical protein n=1 Tax=uncultured Sulfitobacter sp. TaxID=191468 RepID=UPI0026366AEC|nr:hypothetical protein [uncultured Sulfitobacter sp.]
MFEFLFGPSLILAITFAQGSDISETAVTFPDDALVCLRGPYDPCQTKSCDGIKEGQLALDIETDDASHSMIFNAQVFETGTGQTRGSQIISECAQISAGTPVRFLGVDKRRYSVQLRLANRDAP